VALVVATALLAVGCGDDAKTTSKRTLHVFAAASLTEAFTALGTTFEAEHPDVKVAFSFAASSALAQQIDDGADADVLATADQATMAEVVDHGRAADPVIVARNRLAIIVEKGNPKGITGLADLARAGTVLVLCAPEVPCGRFAAAALTKAGVSVTPASLEENVKAVVAKVTLGEADAGIVYATDVRASGDRTTGVAIDIADDPSLEAVYPMAITTSAHAPAEARAWLALVRSARGQRTLARFGFLAP
jgi:molybdate transport system substrate-binding protein